MQYLLPCVCLVSLKSDEIAIIILNIKNYAIAILPFPKKIMCSLLFCFDLMYLLSNYLPFLPFSSLALGAKQNNSFEIPILFLPNPTNTSRTKNNKIQSFNFHNFGLLLMHEIIISQF